MATSKVEGPAIGIDLGTCYSCVGFWRKDKVEIIVNQQGNRTTPSCVAFTPTDCLIGEAAKSQSYKNPSNTIFGSKRLIGKRYEDVNRGVLPFKVIAGEQHEPVIVVEHRGEERQCSPEEISAMVLSYMRTIAETFLGTTVKNAVITVPAYFNDSQRRATRRAGLVAGLNVLRIINEPTAAAIAYRLCKDSIVSKTNVLVFDLGGGTFDLSILEMDRDRATVKATAGDTYLGGDDFDDRMVQYMIGEFKRKYDKDISENQRALSRLRTACENAKRTLSFSTETEIQVDCLHDGFDFECNISRAKFEQLNLELFDKCMAKLEMCLKEAKLNQSDVDEILLVGGSTRIPKVQEMLKDYFNGKEPNRTINPDEAVAYGAAMEAARLNGDLDKIVGDHSIVDDVMRLSIGTDIKGGQMSVVIPRNTPIPAKNQAIFYTVYDNQTDASVDIYEGERLMVADNKLLGKFIISGLSPKPAGETKWTEGYEVDADGILHVWVEHSGSSRREMITINYEKVRMADTESAKMVEEAELHKEDDAERQAKAMGRSNLLYLITNMSRKIDNDDIEFKNMKTEGRTMVKNALQEANDWLDANPDAESRQFDEWRTKLQLIRDQSIKERRKSFLPFFKKKSP